MRALPFGLFAGILCSALRAPTGLDLFQLPAVSGQWSLGLRAAALTLIAMALLASRVPPGGLALGRVLGGWVLGFALHASLIQGAFPLLGLWQLLAGGAVIALLAAWLGRGRDPGPIAASDSPVPTSGPLTCLGLGTAAAGAAIALESVARHLRLLGGGLAQDDSVFGTVFLLLVILGLYLLGRPLMRERARASTAALGLAAAAAASLASLAVLATLSGSRSFEAYMQRYSLSSIDYGTLAADALIAGSALVFPALMVGFACAGVRRRRELASLLVGAALGLCALPLLLAVDPAAPAEELRACSQLVPISVYIALPGAALTALTSGELARARRVFGLVICLLLGFVTATRSVKPIVISDPWVTPPILTVLAFDTPEGLVTLEPSGPGQVATLERRPLTPHIGAVASDVQRLRFSFSLLDPARAARNDLSVLLIGQLTPQRALTLQELGAARIDRTAPWYPALEILERELMRPEYLPSELGPLGGEALSPAAARERLRAGDYDLVIVPPVPSQSGRLPSELSGSAPAGTLIVAWFDTRVFCADRELGERVMLAAERLEDLAIGVSSGSSEEPDPDPGRPRWLPAGKPSRGPGTLSWLTTRAYRREYESRQALARRLAAADPQETGLLMRGLVEHYAAQVHSSPYETEAQRVELSNEALTLMRRATLAGELDAFTRAVWERLARVLVEKRELQMIYEHLEPLAETHEPWPRLELALAQADRESLLPADAARRMEKVKSFFARDPQFWIELAEAHSQAGDHERAAVSLNSAYELVHADDERWVGRLLAMELVRAEDPEGRKLVEALLAEEPQDEELKRYLDPDTLPPRSPQFRPAGGRHDH